MSKSDVPEVDHLLQQETLRTGEILLCTPRLVAHMYDNLSPEGEENEEEKEILGSSPHAVLGEQMSKALVPCHTLCQAPLSAAPPSTMVLSRRLRPHSSTSHLVASCPSVAGSRRVVAAASRAS